MAMKYFAIALASAALMGAQTPGVSIRPTMGGPGFGLATGSAPAVAGSRLGAPVLGFIAGPGPLDVRLILGTAQAAQIGGTVVAPTGTKHIFVPPREHYLLLESTAGEPLAVWSPMRASAESNPVPGASAHPSQVVFSARGDAAAVYTTNNDHLQVINGLPAEPKLSIVPAIGTRGEPFSFAVSDDGQIIVASLADGTALVSVRGSNWQRLPAAYGARAAIFVSRTHNLVISDTAQQTLTLVTAVGESTQSARILAHDLSADRLAVNKEGTILLAASSPQKKVWTVDLTTTGPASVSSAAIDSLLPMRDGHTFLVSSSNMELLNLAADNDHTISLVPVSH
jgi:hypothetical protein